VIAARLASQQLTGPPARSPDEVVTRLLAVQAQDGRGARLSVRSRSSGLTATDVDDALTAGRMVVTWLNRGTLHLVTAQDYWWLHALTTPALATGNARRLGQEGVSAEQARRGADVVAEAVADGPRTRAELRGALDAAGIPTRGQAFVHVLLATSLRGLVVRGPMQDGEHAWVGTRDWLGEAPDALDRSAALARLARRYLAGHGPADAADLARWAGVTLGDARRGLGGIADELTSSDGDQVDLVHRGRRAGLPPPRLLGAFDPLLLGWVSREPFVGAHQQVATANGLFRPVALVDGRVVATWGLAGGAVTIRLLEPVPGSIVDVLEQDAADVLRFLGLPQSAPVTVGP
jgi:hypothetical protein